MIQLCQISRLQYSTFCHHDERGEAQSINPKTNCNHLGLHSYIYILYKKSVPDYALIILVRIFFRF